MAFPKPNADESDAQYPLVPLNPTLGFDLETFRIQRNKLMGSKMIPDSVMTTHKLKQIVSYIRKLGLIEPLSVAVPDLAAAGFLLLHGNLRVLALKKLGQDTAPCLIAKDCKTHT